MKKLKKAIGTIPGTLKDTVEILQPTTETYGRYSIRFQPHGITCKMLFQLMISFYNNFKLFYFGVVPIFYYSYWYILKNFFGQTNVCIWFICGFMHYVYPYCIYIVCIYVLYVYAYIFIFISFYMCIYEVHIVVYLIFTTN